MPHKKTHNLEVPGSSPGWSTLEISNLEEIQVADFSFRENNAKTKGTVLGIKHYGSENSELCLIFSNLFLVNVTNLYIQKEHFTLLDKDGKPSMFALVMIAPLSTCAHL